MLVRVLLTAGLALAFACRGPSESERIRRGLHSADARDVRRAVFDAQHLRERERKAGGEVPTAENAAIVRDVLALFTASRDPELKRLIAASFMVAPVPGPQPELLACGRDEAIEIARSCIAAIGDAHDAANLRQLVDMFVDATIAQAPDAPERLAAVQNAVVPFGDAAIPHLARILHDGGPGARVHALWGLFRLKSEDAAEAALPGLSDIEERVRYVAFEVMRTHPAHRDAIHQLLADPSPSLRGLAADALGTPATTAGGGPP